MSGRMARLAHARLRYSTIYDSECLISRGGVVVQRSVPCLVTASTDANQQIEGQNVPVGAFIVSIPVTYSLQQGDYVTERGRVLEVLSVVTPKSLEVSRIGVALRVGEA